MSESHLVVLCSEGEKMLRRVQVGSAAKNFQRLGRVGARSFNGCETNQSMHSANFKSNNNDDGNENVT